MKESYRGLNKNNRINLIKIGGQNSYKELIEKNKKVIKRKRIGKNKTMKELKILDNIEINKKKI